MLGLIKKELYQITSYAKSIIVVIAVFVIVGFATKNLNYAKPMTILFASLMVISSFSYDQLSNCNKYINSMPIKRSTVIISKYLLSLILVSIAIIFVTLLDVANFWLFKIEIDFLFSVFTGIGALFFASIIIPLIIKFSTEKARMIVVGVVMLPIIIGSFFPNIIPNNKFFGIIVGCVIIASFIASIMISIKLYEKKDL